MLDTADATLFVPTDDLPFLPFGDDFCSGGLEWKLVHTQPDDPRWTAMFRGPAGAAIHPHIHTGPADGYTFYGAVLVHEPYVNEGAGFIREAAGASHPLTKLVKDTCFILTMDGPIRWIRPDGSTVDTSAQDAQQIWDQQLAEAGLSTAH